MKQPTSSARNTRSLLILGFLLFACFTPARAQIQPFVDCVERETDGSGAYTNNYIAYFGYNSTTTATVNFSYNSPNNYFSPAVTPANPPTVFFPGVHPRGVAVLVPVDFGETWRLDGSSATGNISKLCGDDGANSRLITYQGKLSDGNQAANGAYDLQFQLFNAVTGGTARTTQITLEDVSVTNGIFTVQLDLGAASLREGNKTTNVKLNPAILEAENSFFEIGVRAGTSTGAFTTLTPRQPLTAVPLAMRSVTAMSAYRAANANNADNALLANNSSQLGGVAANQYLTTANANTNYIQNTTTQQANSNFNISGGGIIGGTLTANTVTANGFLARGGAPGGFGVNNNGYSFSGGGNTDGGLFSNANGQVSLYTNSGERVRVTDSGLQVFGTLTANTKNFKIDHPLDPLNKTLTYTSIESPDMMNIYNGNITTDANGEAIVKMPDYFEALNKDFRYQLTVIGTFAQAIVAEKIKGNTFKIKTDKPNVEVSWQVAGIRHDRFAEDKRATVEENKSSADKGKCLYAPACQGKP